MASVLTRDQLQGNPQRTVMVSVKGQLVSIYSLLGDRPQGSAPGIILTQLR